jgi:hypothetical protein
MSGDVVLATEVRTATGGSFAVTRTDVEARPPSLSWTTRVKAYCPGTRLHTRRMEVLRVDPGHSRKVEPTGGVTVHLKVRGVEESGSYDPEPFTTMDLSAVGAVSWSTDEAFTTATGGRWYHRENLLKWQIWTRYTRDAGS